MTKKEHSLLGVDRFIKDINANINATLKTKSIDVIEKAILAASNGGGLFIVGENSYQLYKKVSAKLDRGCVYIEPTLNKKIYPRELNKGRLIEIKRFEKQIAKKSGGLFFCDELNKDEIIHVKSNENKAIKIDAGKSIDKKRLETRIKEMGYEHSDTVNHVGEYSVRGGIIDVYAVNINNPIRIEFFGNSIETIRAFNPKSQRSIKILEYVKIENMQITLSTVKSISYKNYIKENNYRVLCSYVGLDRYVLSNKMNKKTKNIYEIKVSTDKTSGASQKRIMVKYDSEVNTLNETAKERDTTKNVQEKEVFRNERIKRNDLISKAETTENSTYSKLETDKNDVIHKYRWGQHITHEDFGVGVYKGVITKNNCDYIKIEYKNNAVIFVSTLKINKICPYIGVPRPRLNTVTNKRWERDFETANKRIAEIINEMIRVNHNREKPRKYMAINRGYIEQELERTFPYIETEDQKKAINDVEKDMSGPGLMDRIIIGDVGFGKTEIAMRAAVKSVVSGGFVVVVVPTTILADQHYISFKGMLEKLGIVVKMLSRFISKKNRDAICGLIDTKQLDILIGTHAVLSDNIPKKRLSLAVIDEEHKFGVSHKNRLLKLKRGIDV